MVSPRKILKITAMRSDAKVATRKGSNWAQIRSLPRRSLFARFELCTAAMCKESETCQVPKTCTKLPHSQLQVNNFVNGIHLQSTFTKRTSSSKLDATVEPRGPPRRLRQLFHHLSGREIVCDPWKFERPWQMMTGPGAFFKKTSPWKYTSLC